MTPEQKAKIDGMSQLEMCKLWRFEAWGHELFMGDTGDYFTAVLKAKGGFTPAISKAIGWGPEP